MRKKLIIVVLDSSAAYTWGGEGIVINGENVGELTSVGWSPRVNACVGMGHARSAAAMKTHVGAPAQIESWGELVAATAWDQWPPKNSHFIFGHVGDFAFVGWVRRAAS